MGISTNGSSVASVLVILISIYIANFIVFSETIQIPTIPTRPPEPTSTVKIMGWDTGITLPNTNEYFDYLSGLFTFIFDILFVTPFKFAMFLPEPINMLYLLLVSGLLTYVIIILVIPLITELLPFW